MYYIATFPTFRTPMSDTVGSAERRDSAASTVSNASTDASQESNSLSIGAGGGGSNSADEPTSMTPLSPPIDGDDGSSGQPTVETMKEIANALFKDGKYTQAVDAYTAAIELSPPTPAAEAILLSNRAAAHLKIENYGSAIQDAAASLVKDPSYLKAYYRRGSALLALSRFKDAKKDFAAVVKAMPTDVDATNKLKACEKEIKRQAFEEAIAVDASSSSVADTVKPDSLEVGKEYKGVHLPDVPGGGNNNNNSSSGSSNSSSSGAEKESIPRSTSATFSSTSGAGATSSSSSSTPTTTPNFSGILPRGAAFGPNGVGATPQECDADETAVNPWGVSVKFVKQLMSDYKSQKSLHKKYVWEILIRVKHLLTSYPSLVHVPWPQGAEHFNVCGDTHGQFYDTCNLFSLTGFPSSTNPYVFNGDFVDRGSFSVENVLLLLALKLLYPAHVHLTRGNHETKNMNKMYGFEGEVKAKYDNTTMDLFAEVFQALPLSVCIDKRALVLHGGLFQQDGVTLDDISKIYRFREPPESGLMTDLLWSDPQPFPGRGPSKRGSGQSFGPDITAKFLALNGLEVLIRSHEVKDEGYVVEHGGKCITVFSAPNYCDQMGNAAAVCRVSATPGQAPSFVTFKAVPHPPVRPMAYASGMQSLFGL